MQGIEDLDSLLKRFTPQDVIAVILASSNLDIFPSERKLLHEFIRQEKKGKGAELLQPFVFSEGVDLYPFSRLLESVLMQLQLGGWLSAKNPEYDRFGVTDEIRADILEKARERFSQEQLEILKNIGESFRALIDKNTKINAHGF